MHVKATLRLFPGITGDIVRAFLKPPIRGAVLETFGAGNAPQRQDLMDALKEACQRGVVIVAISQCAKGSVSAAYETGQTLLQAGVVPGADMTPEVTDIDKMPRSTLMHSPVRACEAGLLAVEEGAVDSGRQKPRWQTLAGRAHLHVRRPSADAHDCRESSGSAFSSRAHIHERLSEFILEAAPPSNYAHSRSPGAQDSRRDRHLELHRV